MAPASPSSRRPARVTLAIAAAGAGIALAGSASAASAACTAPATDAPGGKCRITFTSSGTFTAPAGVTSADVLVVGAGGGGSLMNGGGGGGEVVVKPGYAVTPGSSVAVTVGAAAPAVIIVTGTQTGASGAPSSFGALTAGGGGAAALPADSGGVGGASGTNAGGAGFGTIISGAGGGGAGAGARGADATSVSACGSGGRGVDVSSTLPGLAPSVFGGGGGGGFPDTVGIRCTGGDGGGGAGYGQISATNPGAVVADAGVANTGGGAGGGVAAVPETRLYPTAVGGSGIVVVQYTPAKPILTATVLVPRKNLRTGQATTLAIRASNTGNATASGVTSCLTVPANLVVTRTNGGTRTKGTVCFTVGDLAAGATATRSVTVRGVAARTVTRRVGGNVPATGLTAAVAASPVRVTIRPRIVRTLVVVG